MKKEDPDEGWWENVFGAILPTSASEDRSPAQLVIDKIKEDIPHYDVVCFFIDGSTFWSLSRRRIIVHVFHPRAGGRLAHLRMISYMKACLAHRTSEKPLSITDLCLDFDSDAAQKHLRFIEGQKPYGPVAKDCLV